VGTPRKHKGLDTLIDAFRLITVPARLRVIGGTLDRAFCAKLRKLADPRIEAEAPIPVAELADVLGAADIVAIPQEASRRSVGQLPAKLLDAMAMGKAIVSTEVGDIPRWLGEGAGLVVEPGNAPALANAMQQLMQAPEEARAMGQRARARFLRFGSYCEVRPRLVSVLEKVLHGQPRSSLELAPPSWQSDANRRDEASLPL
jgi:glycosyltransferase involved in cell wall biosynthesis